MHAILLKTRWAVCFLAISLPSCQTDAWLTVASAVTCIDVFKGRRANSFARAGEQEEAEKAEGRRQVGSRQAVQGLPRPDPKNWQRSTKSTCDRHSSTWKLCLVGSNAIGRDLTSVRTLYSHACVNAIWGPYPKPWTLPKQLGSLGASSKQIWVHYSNSSEAADKSAAY